jgi:hypothetical protein
MTLFLLAHNLIKITAVICYPLLLHLYAPGVGATYQRREICMARESERHISEEEICMPRESERQRHISEGERVSDGYDFNQIYSHIFFLFFFISMNLFPYFFLF